MNGQESPFENTPTSSFNQPSYSDIYADQMARDALGELPMPMERHIRTCVTCKAEPGLTVIDLVLCTSNELDATVQAAVERLSRIGI